jgi:alcohol dehydrogenase (cytochrome c)
LRKVSAEARALFLEKIAEEILALGDELLQRAHLETGLPLDRLTGERLVTSKFSDTANWADGLNDKGQPRRIPAKDHHVAGALVSSNNSGATNWPPQAFSPDTGLLYVPSAEAYAMYYLTETDPRGAMGLGGKDEVGVATIGSYIAAIDYKTGRTVWRHRFQTANSAGRAPGLLRRRAGCSSGRRVGQLLAMDPANGSVWHARIGTVSNAPQTTNWAGASTSRRRGRYVVSFSCTQ